MKTRNQILMVSMAFIIAACNLGAPVTPTAAVEAPTPTQTTLTATPTLMPTAISELGRLDWMITAPASPIDLSIDLDTSRSVEAVISPEGGKLEATGADGTHYVLDLPAGSVMMDTLIRMTPVKTVSDLPLKQAATTWAIQLEPEGLQLLADASLTIQFPSPPPVIQQVPFQYQGSGQAFNLAAPVVNAAVDTGVDATSRHGSR